MEVRRILRLMGAALIFVAMTGGGLALSWYLSMNLMCGSPGCGKGVAWLAGWNALIANAAVGGLIAGIMMSWFFAKKRYKALGAAFGLWMLGFPVFGYGAWIIAGLSTPDAKSATIGAIEP